MEDRVLSIFVDESGDFGEYDYHSPYYIISMIFHDQSHSIKEQLSKLDEELFNLGLPKHCIHTGPIIRKEEMYSNMSLQERKSIFNKMIAFTRHVDFKYRSFHIEKKHIKEPLDAITLLAKQISRFIKENLFELSNYDRIIIYYDNGQIEVNKILASVFGALLSDVEFRKVLPADYKLFQVADLICSLKLINLKIENHQLSKSELNFFGNARDLQRNYIRKIKLKEWV